MGRFLDQKFYERSDVDKVARKLLGKRLVTVIDGVMTSGTIVETEAYSYAERGCHAYQNRMTKRNEVMFGSGGHAYIYFCYGMHYMFNVVTNKKNRADAVLIRALQPVQGIEYMMERYNTSNGKRITSGPGKLAKAMGITKKLNGASLIGSEVWIENGIEVSPRQIVTTTRIGIDYAGTDALLPWRFYLKDNEWVSKK